MGVITLGCAKNQVDSEYLLADLERWGFEHTEQLERAAAIVINTCAFIRPAKEESIETILEAARYRESGALQVLAVVGCLAQRYREELERELPEVDLFLGVGAEQRSLGQALYHRLRPGQAPPGEFSGLATRAALTAGQGWAYLKLSEGCDNRCSYCAIPLIRGNLDSRDPAELVAEARRLEAAGVRELNLIAQDLTAYGLDRGAGHPRLEGLLERLLAETTIPWLRLLYAHPAHLRPELLELMSRESRILPYLDLPIQHAADRVLERMGRRYTQARLEESIAHARELLPELVLRTTVLVGFPGERERDFQELLEFIARVRFDRLGGFEYSAEEGTAAHGLSGRVSRAVRERRLAAVLELQREVSAELSAARVGRVLPVLVERRLAADEAPSPEYHWLARSPAHAPEVDGWVYLEDRPGLAPGLIVPARVLEAGDFDLFAAPLKQEG